MHKLLIIALSLSALLSSSAAWAVTIAPTLVARSGAGAAMSKGHIYLVGGINGTIFLKSIEFAPMLQDGGVGAWKDGPRLNMERGFTTATVSGDWLYVLGGANGKNGINLLATVERAKINLDGSLGPWLLEPKLMQTSRRGTVTVTYKENIYAMGGYSGTFLPTVERAKINPDGSLGPWIYEPSEMNDARYIHGAAIHGDTLYVVGGHNEATGGALSSVEYCKINPDGSLGQWSRTSSLIEARYLTASAVVGDYLYVFGGFNGKAYLQTVEKAKINRDGSLGPWTKTASLSVPREGAAPVVYRDTAYLIGGSNTGGYLTSSDFGKAGASGDIARWISTPAASSHAGTQAKEPPAVQYVRAGVQLMDQGKLDDAVFAFQSAVKTDKNLAEAYFYLGIAYLQKNRNRDAVKTLETGARLAPVHNEMHYNLACAYSRDGQVKNGLESLGKALALGFDPAAARQDKDLANLRKDPGFEALFKGKKKKSGK